MSTRIDEIADSIYRISTPVPPSPGLPAGFSFNQYLVVDDEPLLFHTGLRGLFPAVADAMRRVMSPDRLRWISFSHWEADESGALNEWLSAAPAAAPLCGQIAAMISVGDQALRPARALADGDAVVLGARTVTWRDAPHVPHGWDCGFLYESSTRTLLCGDLFTQPGTGERPVSDGDVLGPSEAMRTEMDYYAHAPSTRAVLERLAALEPRTLACMHGSAWQGDGAALLRELASRF
jgi:flavorubredoxin